MFSRIQAKIGHNGKRVVGLALASSPFILLADTAYASEAVHPTLYPWDHTGYFSTFDHSSLRRGYQVYKEVCAACHSMNRIYYRHLVGVTHTEEQAKKEAAMTMVVDGPNDEGEYFLRPGKLQDRFPAPYDNELAARAANNGAYPPDLSLIIKAAHHDGLNYVYSLLTGFKDPPAGRELMAGQYYNPYFTGGALSMAPPLQDGAVDYPDGTVATVSQMAHDVCQFLHWCGEPEYVERKMWGLPVFTSLFIAWITVTYHKRYLFGPYLTQKIVWKKPPYMKF